jgi:beta-glucosidase
MKSTLFRSPHRLARCTLAASAVTLLVACAHAPQCVSAAAAAAQPDAQGHLVLYDGRPGTGVHVEIGGFNSQQPMGDAGVTLSGATINPQMSGAYVAAHRSEKTGTDDALSLQWSNAWLASLRLVADHPLDLRPYLPDGTLEFDVDPQDMAKSGLNFGMGCGTDCQRTVKYVLPSRAMQGKGWQHLSFSLKCFARDGNDFSAITRPFVLDTSNTGEVAVANVRIAAHGTPNAACADYRTESVTPAPLAEVWALDWWMPRHEEKLKLVREQNAAGRPPQLVFIGDSITNYWETTGAKVWAQYFARYNAVDLGFGGDRTENVLWRLEHGEVDHMHPKVAVLMIGTNNTGDRQEDPLTTAAGVQRLLGELRSRLPDTKILLLAVFPRGAEPTDRLREINDRVNGLISAYADNQHIFFLNIGNAFLGPDGTLSKDIMPDLLHPNETGYGIWARTMEPTLQKLMAQ